MRQRLRGFVTGSLLPLALLLTVAAPAAAKSYSAARFDSHVRVLPGNVLEVTETVVFEFRDGTFQRVFREIPTRRTDGIDIVAATMDGTPMSFGDGTGQVEVRRKDGIRVDWHFPKTTGSHAFGLKYLVHGAITQGADGDELHWQALPSDHEYAIGASTVEFVFDVPGARLLREPRVETRRVGAEPSVTPIAGVAEAGPLGDPPAFRTQTTAIRRDGWLAARFVAPAGSLISEPPAWQARQNAIREVGPRWLLGGAGLLGIGLLALFGVRQQYQRPAVDAGSLPSTDVPPDTLPPALAGALVTNGHISQTHALATLFDLGQRGDIIISEVPGGRFTGRKFVARPGRRSHGLTASEQALRTLVLGDGASSSERPLSKGWQQVVRRFREFSSPLRSEMAAAGFIDAGRVNVKRRTQALGIALIVGALAVLAAAGLLARSFGPWPLALPVGLALAGVVALITAASTTPLSDEGVRRARRWRAYRDSLKAAAKSAEARVDVHGAILPTAVALGLGAVWAKRLAAHPGLMPDWLHALPGNDNAGALVAIMHYGNSGHHGAGASAAGAAGGGASGAS